MASIIIFLCVVFLAPAFAHGAATMADCGGPNKIIAFKSGSVKPDPVQYPGDVSLTALLEVLKDLPASDFELQVNMDKLDPRRMTLPCLENIGSCTYDICEMIEAHRSVVCPMFPDPDECGCPMKAGTYNVKDAPLAIPDLGDALAQILEGHYEANLTLIDRATNTEIGCSSLTFEIVPSS